MEIKFQLQFLTVSAVSVFYQRNQSIYQFQQVLRTVFEIDNFYFE